MVVAFGIITSMCVCLEVINCVLTTTLFRFAETSGLSVEAYYIAAVIEVSNKIDRYCSCTCKHQMLIKL